jgi:energy-coupling factor transporter ATP-binding protein EcfA2
MATRRLLVGGPSNSGKSTFLLSLVELLNRDRPGQAVSIELDVWSRSYPAFRGEVPFENRPKMTGLDWDWQTPLDQRLKEFNEADAEIVFGDMPGAKIDVATQYMCTNAQAGGAVIISRAAEGLVIWRDAFRQFGLEVQLECLTLRGAKPLMLRDPGRVVNPDYEEVAVLKKALGFFGEK